MNHSLTDSPLCDTSLTKDKMEKWVKAQAKGEKINIDVYGKPTDKQLKDLENVRKLSKELQENLHELETSVRIADVENEAMNPTAPILDYSDEHEFVSANKLDDYYAEEDKADAKEEEKRRLTKGTAARSPMQLFFKGQCMFLTGGTGFLGRVLIEKILRSCNDIDTLYVMVRPKKGKDVTTRLRAMLDDVLYSEVHKKYPKAVFKLVPVEGDMMLPGLGLSAQDRKTLIDRVTLIVNAAATVKFDEKLSIATGINVRGTKEVLALAKECRNLKAITHVSTAFSNTLEDHVLEKFYDPPISVETLEAISQIEEDILEKMTPQILGKYPNTYCFTKAVAESAVRKYGEGLPICLFRPSIVISTYEEPIRGWTGNIYGPSAVMVGAGTGVIRTVQLDKDKVADMVPVDLTVNAILSTLWHTAKNYKENQTSEIPVYNYVSGAQNPQTWGEFIEMNRKHGIHTPTMKAVWYYGLTTTKNYYVFRFLNFFLHFLPALLVDTFFEMTGNKKGLLEYYYKASRLANALVYFATNQWSFSDEAVQGMWAALSDADQTIFPFNIKDISWDYHAETYLLGLRVYILKENISTVAEAKKKWNRLYYMHNALKIVTFGVLFYIAYSILSFTLRTIFC